jgi:virulence factor Mce-like protein
MRRGQANFGGHILTIVLFVGVAIAFCVYILGQAGTIPTLGEKYTVKAIVPTANLLTPGARVTIAGAEVGALKKVEAAGPTSPYAKLTLELTDDRVFPLPRDSRLRIRTRSQVGENYVGIDVGDDDLTIPDGGTIGIDNADELVNVDQLLSTLQGRTRERTRKMFQSLGTGLDGRGGELNRTLGGFSGLVTNGQQLVETVQQHKQQTAQLVDELGQVMSAVGDRQAALTTLAREGTRSLQAIAARDAELRETLRELPATLRQVAITSNTIGRVSDTTAPVIDDLAVATRAIKPAVEDLAPTAFGAIPLMRAVGDSRPDIDWVTDTVIQIGDNATPALQPIKKLLCQVNPTLRYLNPRLRDTLTIVSHLGSSSNAYDATGHTIRLQPVENEGYLAGAPAPILEAEHALLQSGFLLPSKVQNWNPYPEVGSVGTATALGSGGHPANPDELRESGYKYPRVTADC